MPFQSEKQRRYLHANHPEIAKRWERDYATGGISNHFRKRFFKGAQADTAQGKAMSPGTSASGGLRHSGNGGGGDGHHPPVYTGPTPEEIAAAKAKAEAEKRALETAARKKYLADFKGTQTKKTKHKKKIESMGFDEFQKFGTGVQDYYKNLEHQNKIKAGKLDFGEQEWQNLIVPGLMNLKTSTLETPEYDFSEIEGQQAGLTKKQKQMLSGSQKNLKNIMGISNEQILENIKMWDDPDDPATIKDIETFYSAKGGVARKNYYHGGILDINESEEIIDDGGNEIELTDYNAAFDDPNDLSTGVKSLFRAKEGGNVRLGPHTATDLLAKKNPDGTRSKYQPPGHVDAPAPSSDRGPRDAPDRFGPTTTTTTTSTGGDNYQDRIIEIQDRQRKADLKDIIARGDEEKYDTDLVDTKGKSVMTPQEKYLANRNMIKSKYTGTSTQRKNALTKNYNDEKARQEKAIRNTLIKKGLLAWAGLATFGLSDFINVDVKGMKLTGLVSDVMTLDQLKKQHIDDLTDMKESLLVDVDITNPNEMKNLDNTAFPDIMRELTDLTQTRDEDDKGDGGPEPILDPVTLEVGTEYAQGDYGMSDLDRIRAGQAKRAMLVQRGIIQDNPIVDESITDITMQANKGGLANLFRVKKQ